MLMFPLSVTPGSNLRSSPNRELIEKSFVLEKNGLARSVPLPKRLIFTARAPLYLYRLIKLVVTPIRKSPLK